MVQLTAHRSWKAMTYVEMDEITWGEDVQKRGNRLLKLLRNARKLIRGVIQNIRLKKKKKSS